MRVTGFDVGAYSTLKPVTLMVNSNERIVKHKIGLLNLAEELGKVSRACKVLGLSWDTFYRYKEAVEDGGVEALLDKNRRKPNLKNWIGQETEQAVLVSPSGVRSIWLRHNLANLKNRLKAQGEKMANDNGLILTEAQVQALEKKKHDETRPAVRSKPSPQAILALRILSM